MSVSYSVSVSLSVVFFVTLVGSSHISILDLGVCGCDLGLLSFFVNMHSFGDLILLWLYLHLYVGDSKI